MSVNGEIYILKFNLNFKAMSKISITLERKKRLIATN